MTAQIIPFPVRAVIPALPDTCTGLEEARHVVARLRAKRDACPLGSRQWQVEQIKLDWWEAELATIASAANNNIIPLRRA